MSICSRGIGISWIFGYVFGDLSMMIDEGFKG